MTILNKSSDRAFEGVESFIVEVPCLYYSCKPKPYLLVTGQNGMDKMAQTKL